MNKIKESLILFIIQKLFFWVKHNETSPVQNKFFLFSELHDVKTERNMSCKELFDKQCPLVQYRKKWKHTFNFHLNRIKV